MPNPLKLAEIGSECVACGCCVRVCPRDAVQVLWGIRAQADPEKCIGCGACLKTGCPALQRKGNKVTIDQTLCNACGLCAGLCPKQCMEGASK